MHEFSIVQALIASCEQHAAAEGATAITRVKLSLGALCGVEPSLLATAFDTFKLEGLCKEAVLEMEIEPLRLSCSECDFSGEAEGHSVLCPRCHSPFTKVTGGEEMLLLQLELEGLTPAGPTPSPQHN